MRRTLLVLALAVVPSLSGCSKKASSPPTAPGPACEVNPTTLSFGPVVVGSSAERTFTLANAGGGTLNGTVTESCSEFSLVGTNTYSLGAGETATFTLQFSPSSTGAKNCAVNTGTACAALNCSGVGQTSSDCQVAPNSLDFGSVTVGQSADRTFTVTNSATGTLTGAVSEGCADFSVVGSAAYSLSGGQSATFTVRFAPSQAGSHACTLSTGVPACAAVSCLGTAAAVNSGCAVSVTELTFGQVGIGDRSDATFAVTNNGMVTLSGTVTESCTDFSIAGQASYTLAPAQSQTFIVRFAPTQAGEQTCTVEVGPGCATVAGRGTGVVGCLFQPAALDFGYVRRGETRCGTATLTNNTSSVQQGMLDAGSGGAGGNAGRISLDGVIVSGTTRLPYSLGPGQSRTLAVCWDTQFASAPCDTILAQWGIGSTASSSAGCLSAALGVRGIITRGCVCSITPTTLSFGGVVVGDASPEQAFQITNESGIDGLRGSVRVLSGEFETSQPDYVCSSALCVSCGFIEPLVKVYARFRPTSLGPQVGKIVVENLVGCLGPGSSSVCDTVTVTGTGVTVSPPACGLSTNTIDMGDVYFGSFKDTTFTIRNTGGGILADSIKFLDNAPPFLALTRYYALGPGDSVKALIRFISSGTPGHVYTYIGNVSAGALCMAQGLGIQVTAVAREAPLPPACGVSPTLLDFGTVAVGQSRDLTFDLRNTGGGTLCGTVTESCPDFSIEVTPDYCITPPAFRRLTIRFAPTATGPRQCTISAGTGCPAVTVRGMGN